MTTTKVHQQRPNRTKTSIFTLYLISRTNPNTLIQSQPLIPPKQNTGIIPSQLQQQSVNCNDLQYLIHHHLQDMSLQLITYSSPSVKLEDSDTESKDIKSSHSSNAINRNRTWKKNELYLIAAFFFYNQDKFESEASKKRFKVFKYMSLFIESRNINQCRTFTTKLLRRFGSIKQILSFFRQSLPHCSLVVQKLARRNERILYGRVCRSMDDELAQQELSLDAILANVITKTEEKQSIQKVIQVASSGMEVKHMGLDKQISVSQSDAVPTNKLLAQGWLKGYDGSWIYGFFTFSIHQLA